MISIIIILNILHWTVIQKFLEDICPIQLPKSNYSIYKWNHFCDFFPYLNLYLCKMQSNCYVVSLCHSQNTQQCNLRVSSKSTYVIKWDRNEASLLFLNYSLITWKISRMQNTCDKPEKRSIKKKKNSVKCLCIVI